MKEVLDIYANYQPSRIGEYVRKDSSSIA